MIAIPDNVWAFISRASDDVGRLEAECFAQDMQTNIVEGVGIESPIEQMFLVALHVMCKANYERVDPEPDMTKDGELVLRGGVFITPQFQVGKFKVDFKVKAIGWGQQPVARTVLVELDGHAFHDKDQRQRSYEKARDRYLTKMGHRVLHFTGSDVVKDPYRVAHEVLDTLECYGGLGAQPYDPRDPFSLGV